MVTRTCPNIKTNKVLNVLIASQIQIKSSTDAQLHDTMQVRYHF